MGSGGADEVLADRLSEGVGFDGGEVAIGRAGVGDGEAGDDTDKLFECADTGEVEHDVAELVELTLRPEGVAAFAVNGLDGLDEERDDVGHAGDAVLAARLGVELGVDLVGAGQDLEGTALSRLDVARRAIGIGAGVLDTDELVRVEVEQGDDDFVGDVDVRVGRDVVEEGAALTGNGIDDAGEVVDEAASASGKK